MLIKIGGYLGDWDEYDELPNTVAANLICNTSMNLVIQAVIRFELDRYQQVTKILATIDLTGQELEAREQLLEMYRQNNSPTSRVRRPSPTGLMYRELLFHSPCLRLDEIRQHLYLRRKELAIETMHLLFQNINYIGT